jgi:hypothetical protein
MYNDEFAIIQRDMARLKDEVLSRIRTVERIRAFLRSPASNATITLVLILCASIFVSFNDVVHNIMAQGEWGGRVSYTYLAIMQARVLVQVFAGLTSVSCLVLLFKVLMRLKAPAYFIGNFFVTRSPVRFFRS